MQCRFGAPSKQQTTMVSLHPSQGHLQQTGALYTAPEPSQLATKSTAHVQDTLVVEVFKAMALERRQQRPLPFLARK